MLLEIIKSNLTIEEKSQKVLQEHPYLLKEEFEKFNDEEIELFFNNLNNEAISRILEYIDEEVAADLLEDLDINKTVEILNEMPSDDAIDIIQELENKEDILEIIDDDIKILDEYDDEETGSIMATEYVHASPTDTSNEVFEMLVRVADKVESINQIYVVVDGALIGVVELNTLISAGDKKISEIMNTNYIYADAHENKEETIEKIRNYDLNIIPVLENGRLVGIVTVDDAMENYVDEIEEDYAKFSGLIEEEYIEEGILKSFKKRVPWLLILLILDVFISLVISNYEHIISGLTILVSFQPVILGLAGNAGTQSLAICVRGISDGSLKGKKAFKHIFKELFIGGLLGVLVGLGVFLVVLAFVSIKGGDYNIFKVSMVVGISTLVALVFSSSFGAIFPIILNKIKIDPAMASGPFITTINDCIAILIYFSLASLLLLQMA